MLCKLTLQCKVHTSLCTVLLLMDNERQAKQCFTLVVSGAVTECKSRKQRVASGDMGQAAVAFAARVGALRRRGRPASVRTPTCATLISSTVYKCTIYTVYTVYKCSLTGSSRRALAHVMSRAPVRTGRTALSRSNPSYIRRLHTC